MVKSFRGVEVDFNSLVKNNEKAVALGNAHFNAKGDLLGRGGKIIKAREEQLKEYDEAKLRRQEGSVMLGDDGKENIVEETPVAPVKRGRKPKKNELISDIESDDGFIADEEK